MWPREGVAPCAHSGDNGTAEHNRPKGVVFVTARLRNLSPIAAMGLLALLAGGSKALAGIEDACPGKTAFLQVQVLQATARLATGLAAQDQAWLDQIVPAGAGLTEWWNPGVALVPVSRFVRAQPWGRAELERLNSRLGTLLLVAMCSQEVGVEPFFPADDREETVTAYGTRAFVLRSEAASARLAKMAQVFDYFPEARRGWDYELSASAGLVMVHGTQVVELYFVAEGDRLLISHLMHYDLFSA